MSPRGSLTASEWLHGAFRDTCRARVNSTYPRVWQKERKFRASVVVVLFLLLLSCTCVGLVVYFVLLAKNTIIKNEKKSTLKERERESAAAPRRLRLVHQLVLLRSSVAMQRFSCVNIEPTYDHEREGRGNFVREGKSGELASPPSLTQHARSRLLLLLLPADSARQAASRSKQQQQRQRQPGLGCLPTGHALTFMVQSILAASASRSRSFSRFTGCCERARQCSFPASLHCIAGKARKASALWRRASQLLFFFSFFFAQTIDRMTSLPLCSLSSLHPHFSAPPSFSLSLSLLLSI